MNYSSTQPIFVTNKNYYQTVAGPFELKDGSILYLLRPFGRIFPSKEYSERRYYLRICKDNIQKAYEDDSFFGEKLHWRKADVYRIVNAFYDMDFEKPQGLQKYNFYIAKIHNDVSQIETSFKTALTTINPQDITLVDMNLSVYTFKYLRRANINNLQELVSLPPNRLEAICMHNDEVLKEIYALYAAYDIPFLKLP